MLILFIIWLFSVVLVFSLSYQWKDLTRVFATQWWKLWTSKRVWPVLLDVVNSYGLWRDKIMPLVMDASSSSAKSVFLIQWMYQANKYATKNSREPLFSLSQRWTLRGAFTKKCHKLWKKSIIFLTTPPPLG